MPHPQHWYEPGVEAVAPGVFRIPLPMPPPTRAVNVYALPQPNGVVLIDSGLATNESFDALTDGLRSLGFALSDIQQVLVTHLHYDHIAQAVRLREDYGVPFALGLGERDNVDAMVQQPGLLQPVFVERVRDAGALELVTRLEPHFHAGPGDLIAPPDDWLADGQNLVLHDRTLQVIATPGHTQGHIALIDEECALLFSGDHVLPELTTPVGFEPVPSTEPLVDFERSLRRLLHAADAMMLPAHGPVTATTHARVRTLLGQMDRRRERVFTALSDGDGTAADVASRLRWARGTHGLKDLGPVQQLTAINEVLAVLETQIASGSIVRMREQGVWLFSAVPDRG